MYVYIYIFILLYYIFVLFFIGGGEKIKFPGGFRPLRKVLPKLLEMSYLDAY